MKQSFQFHALLLFLLLIFSTRTSARFMATKQGTEEIKLNEITSGNSDVEMEGNDSLDVEQLMGLEDCDSGDEECLTRRIVSEAHLDYIYTQHHKP